MIRLDGLAPGFKSCSVVNDDVLMKIISRALEANTRISKVPGQGRTKDGLMSFIASYGIRNPVVWADKLRAVKESPEELTRTIEKLSNCVGEVYPDSSGLWPYFGPAAQRY